MKNTGIQVLPNKNHGRNFIRFNPAFMILRYLLFIFCVTSHCCLSQIPPSAKQAVESLEKRLGASVTDTSRVNILMDLVGVYREFDLKKATTFSWEGYQLSKKIGYALGLGRGCYNLALIAMVKGDLIRSDSLLTAAEKIFIQLKDTDRRARVFNSRGELNYLKGNYWLAGDYFEKAAKTYEQLKDTIHYLNCYSNLIAVLSETENRKKAIVLANAMLPIARKTTDTIQVFYFMEGLVNNLASLGDFTSASAHIPELLQFASRTHDYHIAADIYNTAGAFYLKQKKYELALQALKKAQKKANEFGDSFITANVLSSLGAVYLSLNEKKQAIAYLNRSLVLAKQFENTRAQYETSKLLSEYHARYGDSNKAYTFLLNHLALKDSIRTEAISNHVAYLEAKYESEKKQRQIGYLQLNNAEKELIIVKRNQLLLLGGVGSTAIIIILTLFYRNSVQKQTISENEQSIQKEQIRFLERQQQIVSLQSMVNGQETERTRIAKDLHDGLGGLFSTVKMYLSSLEHEQQHLKESTLFKKSFEMVDTAATEVRRIAHNMMPGVLLKLGLKNALLDLCNNISAGRLLQVSLVLRGMEDRLNASTEIMLYRITQELLNNIVKHANASHAIVQFIRAEDRLSVTVEDDGKGFDTEQVFINKNTGMENIKSRVNYLNGRISIESQQGLGTTIMMDFLIHG